MKTNQRVLQQLHKSEEMKSVATCLYKDNNYWIYHRDEIENAEDEKTNPADKLWLVMRYMQTDEDH